MCLKQDYFNSLVLLSSFQFLLFLLYSQKAVSPPQEVFIHQAFEVNWSVSIWEYLTYSLADFRVLSLPEKKIRPPYFFDEKSNFLPVPDSEPRFWKRCSGVCCQTVTYNEWYWSKHLIFIQNFTFWEIFQVSWSAETPFLEVTRLRFLFTRCPLLFNCWLS